MRLLAMWKLVLNLGNIPHDMLTAWIFWIVVFDMFLNIALIILVFRKKNGKKAREIREESREDKRQKKTKKPGPRRKIPEPPGQEAEEKAPKEWKEEKFE
jgi:hypothetical protein